MMATRRSFFATALGGILAAVGLKAESGTRVPLGCAHDFMPGEDPALRAGPTGPSDGDVLLYDGGEFRWTSEAEARAVVAQNIDAAKVNRLMAEHYDRNWLMAKRERDFRTALDVAAINPLR